MDRLQRELLLAKRAALGDLDGFADALQAEDVPARRRRDALHGSQADRALQVRQSPVILFLRAVAATTLRSLPFIFVFVFRGGGRGCGGGCGGALGGGGGGWEGRFHADDFQLVGVDGGADVARDVLGSREEALQVVSQRLQSHYRGFIIVIIL